MGSNRGTVVRGCLSPLERVILLYLSNSVSWAALVKGKVDAPVLRCQTRPTREISSNNLCPRLSVAFYGVQQHGVLG